MARLVSRVLIDSSARKNGALIGRRLAERATAMWGHHEVGWNVTRLQAKVLDPNAHWLRAQIPFISSVAAAMRAGQLEACTSSELLHEGSFLVREGNTKGDLWEGVAFTHVDPPLERSTWMGSLEIEQVFSGEHQQEFCEQLVHYARGGVPQSLLEVLELDDFQRANIARLGEYLELCEAVGRTRYRDAFHLWTALCHGLDYFLTTDETFVRIVREQCAKIDLLLPAVVPSELVDALHLRPGTIPISEAEIIPYPFD